MKKDSHTNRTLAKYMQAVKDIRCKLATTDGQATTEYAVLVGVLVVIAMLSITLFRPKLQELWDAIASGVAGL